MQTRENPQAIATVEVPGYSGGFVSVAAGQSIRITDIAGGQIGDMFAISARDHNEFLSPSVTRLHNLNLFPSVSLLRESALEFLSSYSRADYIKI